MAGAGADFVQGGFSILSGLQEKENLKSQAYAAEYQAQINRLQGRQASAAQREDLVSTLSAIRVLRTQRGLSADSPTARAIRKSQRKQSAVAENTAVLSHNLSEMSNRERGNSLRHAAPWAAAGGFTQGLSSFAKGGEKIAAMLGRG